MITIAIPFYNAEKFLPDAIRSVFAQSFQDWELILIDDGSTDSSLKIANTIDDPRVRVYSDGKNKRLAARLNEVTQLAKYNYIARMDADDIMHPNRLEIQIEILERNSHIDLVSTGMYSISNDDVLRGVRGSSFDNPNLLDLLQKKTGILHASLLVRKEWYLRNKYNDKLKLGQDTELWYRAAKRNDLKIKIIETPLYFYREEGNVTREKLLRAYKNEREYLAGYIDNNFFQIKYIVKSYLKSSFVTLFGTPAFLLNRRNQTINHSQKNDFDYSLNFVKNTIIE